MKQETHSLLVIWNFRSFSRYFLFMVLHPPPPSTPQHVLRAGSESDKIRSQRPKKNLLRYFLDLAMNKFCSFREGNLSFGASIEIGWEVRWNFRKSAIQKAPFIWFFFSVFQSKSIVHISEVKFELQGSDEKSDEVFEIRKKNTLVW